MYSRYNRRRLEWWQISALSLIITWLLFEPQPRPHTRAFFAAIGSDSAAQQASEVK